MSTAYITLTSGETVALIYSWTFGEMAIVCVLLALLTVICAQWIYDVVNQLWSWRAR